MKELLITRRCQNCRQVYYEYEGGGTPDRGFHRITILVHHPAREYRCVETVYACSIECARILTARVKVQEPEQLKAAAHG